MHLFLFLGRHLSGGFLAPAMSLEPGVRPCTDVVQLSMGSISLRVFLLRPMISSRYGELYLLLLLQNSCCHHKKQCHLDVCCEYLVMIPYDRLHVLARGLVQLRWQTQFEWSLGSRLAEAGSAQMAPAMSLEPGVRPCTDVVQLSMGSISLRFFCIEAYDISKVWRIVFVAATAEQVLLPQQTMTFRRML